ncbi:hypothetical protein P4S72_13950 [Vibrio sp. PP-XX7]
MLAGIGFTLGNYLSGKLADISSDMALMIFLTTANHHPVSVQHDRKRHRHSGHRYFCLGRPYFWDWPTNPNEE